jgi:hypothetical protein
MRRGTLLAMLLAINASLLWVLVDALQVPADDGVLPAHGAPVAIATAKPEPLTDRFAGKSASDFPHSLDRPLFWPSRRPIVASAPISVRVEQPPARTPEEPIDVRLAGIMQVGRTSRRALLVWPRQPAGQWVVEGTDLDGWRILKIDPASVRIGIGSRVQLLELY